MSPAPAATVGPVRALLALTAAASALVRPVLGRPVTLCPVVAASRTGMHLATGHPDLPLLSVVAPGGARLPGACVLAGAPAEAELALARLGAADAVLVGDGRIALGDLSVVVHRWWSQPAVRVPKRWPDLRAGQDALAAALHRTGQTAPTSVAGAVDQLVAAVEREDPSAVRRAVQAMVGLGPGLTPAADDVLVGAVLCWHHLGRAGWPGAAETARTVFAAVVERLDRTTAVSAALLHHAALGASVPEGLLLLAALRTPPAVAPALHELVRIGHDTGRSIADGIQIGIRVTVLADERRSG